jgi:hypothetical protein
VEAYEGGGSAWNVRSSVVVRRRVEVGGGRERWARDRWGGYKMNGTSKCPSRVSEGEREGGMEGRRRRGREEVRMQRMEEEGK